MKNKEYQLHFIEQEKKLNLGTSDSQVTSRPLSPTELKQGMRALCLGCCLSALKSIGFKGSETPFALTLKGYSFNFLF